MKLWILKDEDVLPTTGWEDAFIIAVNREKASTAFSNVPKIWSRLKNFNLEEVYEDLFIIGLAVYSVDKRVSRREFADCWTRELEVCIPVIQYEIWEKTESKWNQLLSFLTGDHWVITFRKTNQVWKSCLCKRRSYTDISKNDCVSLFSGGLDSYCGAIRLLDEGKSPCLIGHNEYPKLRYKQEEFCNTFKTIYPLQHPMFISFTAGARMPRKMSGEGLEGVENTSRGRSLLFLCTAVSIAGAMGEKIPVYIPENGFIGLNVALTNNRLGSCSTRTTHPAFLNALRDLLGEVGIYNPIENFFAFMTKREIVRLVKDSDAFLAHYMETISCSHPCQPRYARIGSREYPKNCGFCYPDIIRKSSLLDMPEDGNYRYDITPSQFLEQYGEYEISADLRAIVSSIYRYKHSNESDIRRLVWRTGKLKTDDILKYIRVYKEGMSDLKEWIDRDHNMGRYFD